jgi:XTP/dITP diphosphohydrolase
MRAPKFSELLLCTGNAGKVAELRHLLPAGVRVTSLAEAGMPLDLPETGDTLEANALQKARYAYERSGLPCLADDTGLEVDALGGAPGVRSARYAGPEKDAQANMRKLLEELQGQVDRRARFRTVIAFVAAGIERCFEGKIEGVITHAPRGAAGFGYDPIFQPSGHSRTFAEMSIAEKNTLSHRAEAMRKAVAYLSDQPR